MNQKHRQSFEATSTGWWIKVKIYFSLQIWMDWLSHRVPLPYLEPVLPMFFWLLDTFFWHKVLYHQTKFRCFPSKTEKLSEKYPWKWPWCWSKWCTDLLSPHWPFERSIQGTIFLFQKWNWSKNISGATKVDDFLTNERAGLGSRPNGEHKNPTIFDFVVNISPPKVNNTGCCINHHSFCDDFCLQHPKRRRQTAILSILAFGSRVKAT